MLAKLLGTLVVTVFSLAAAFLTWWLVTTFSLHHAARTWVAVEAQVLDFDLHHSSSTGTKGRTTRQSRLSASYAYSYEGLPYQGDRVDFSFGADNFSGKRRSEQMRQLRRGTITIYVDPAAPEQSVFDRRLPGAQVTFALIFLLFPCGIGTAVLAFVPIYLLKQLGLERSDKFSLPLLGSFHGSFALYPAWFAPGDFGLFGWLVLLTFLALLALSLWSMLRHLRHPDLPPAGWSQRLEKRRKPGP